MRSVKRNGNEIRITISLRHLTAKGSISDWSLRQSIQRYSLALSSRATFERILAIALSFTIRDKIAPKSAVESQPSRTLTKMQLYSRSFRPSNEISRRSLEAVNPLCSYGLSLANQRASLFFARERNLPDRKNSPRRGASSTKNSLGRTWLILPDKATAAGQCRYRSYLG